MDDWLAKDGDRWAAATCGLSVPRQNGKNAALEIRELFGAVGLGEKILHTAHEVKTAQKHFRRLKHFFGRRVADPKAQFPELNALVAELRNVNGQEAIFLANGGSIEIVARSKGSARGYTVDVIVCDEAQDMSDEDLEALGPTSSAAPLGDPQKIYTGTPPGPKVNGEVFTRSREAALRNEPRRVWHEWSAVDGVDLDDRDVWVTVNPGLVTGRLLWSEVEDNRTDYSDEGFARERLGQWSTSAAKGVIPLEFWERNGDDLSVPAARFALGLEVGPDLVSASVSFSGQRPDARWHVELDENRQGAYWLAPYVERLIQNNPEIRAVAGDVGGPLAALLEQKHGRWFLKGTKVVVTPLAVRELGAACSVMFDGIVTGDIVHIRQPQLTAAVTVAGKRTLGDTGMWVFHRASSVSDITPIQAATLALWGAQNMNVKRPGRSRDSERRAGVL